jgi:hypothetical protein
MASEKQIAANRQNALKAGIKSHQASLAVKSNAVSHGIFSKECILPNEDAQLLAKLSRHCISEFKPVGEMEAILVDIIITSAWRLKRVFKNEFTHSTRSDCSLTDPSQIEISARNVDYRFESWQKLMKYQTAIERQMYRAMSELERRQRTRLGEVVPPPISLDVNLSSDVVSPE